MSWGGGAYFGEPGTRDDGKSFEIRVFGNPTAVLTEGDKLGRWPAADFGSPVVRVTRGSDVAGRRLATILFTDIVRSTEHVARLRDANWSALLDRHYSIIRDEVSRVQGRGIRKTGDGFLATFDSPAQAIDCATAIVNRVRSLGIEVRAGVHTAEIEVSPDDIIGIAVHLGARVMATAAPSEVLVTRTVRDLVFGSGIEPEPVGPHALRGFEDEWHLFRVKSG
jgi:class 3 adenylate cyclase